ncbi:hypothetical protein LEN26_015250 [Aphanomyces euteiches]|nr:hypothetical protein LEN26_015250 [Aphanomyces euteiches]KAH9107715.1 hypothetical protein AeMF1_017000 [Aphanomyces euteiches]KAH9196445.1 hypothetical protein AeNC1_001589 [Aphanomyces euteiches]
MDDDKSLINGGYGPITQGKSGLVETIDDDLDGYDDDEPVTSSSAIILHPQPQHQATSGGSSWNYSTAPQLFRGLSNQGATCYMNSLLQSLYMTPEFRRRLYQSETVAKGSSDDDLNIPFQLQKLFAHLQLSKNRRAIDTKALTKSFGWNSSDVFQQHDVQELCRVLFDALEESLKGTKHENLVNELYQGQLKDYVQCATCGNESSRLDNFLDLSLVIRPFGSTQMMRSVEEAIEFFLKPEMLSEGNQWDCSKCAKKQDAIKGLKFNKLPDLLSLQLKRFDFDYTTFNRIKLNNEVKFPKYLNMNTYVQTTKGGTIARKMSLERQELNEKHDSTPSSPLSRTDDDEGTENDADDDLYEQEDTWRSDYDVQAVIDASGPYVYELFSVLIHSGSAMGGHYYAYIKSFEDGQWYNFNDSNVSKITEAEVRTAWGPKPTSISTSTSSHSMYYRSSHSTCAYMLMYRIVSAKNETSVSDEEVPQFLKDVIKDDEDKREQREREREEKARMIQLKIFHPPGHKTMHISKLTPLSEVTEKAAMLFDVPYDPTLVRLRSYSEYTNLPQETYTGREHCSLMQLQLYTHSSLFLEVRSSPEDEWVEYDSSALQLLVRKYEALPKPHFTEPAYVLQIADDSTVEDLVEVLRVKYGLDRDKCRVLHMSASGYWSIQTSILNPADEDMYMKRALRQDIHLRQGSEVYVEECPSLDTWSDAKDLFETQAHLITIQVKCKDKNILTRKNDPAANSKEGATWPFVVDRREPLQILKDQLVKFLDMPANTFKLCRGSSDKAQELKALDVSFKNLTLMDNSTLFLAAGRPLTVGEFHVQIQWYQPKPQPTEPSIFLQGWSQSGEMSWLTTLVVSGDMMVEEMREAIAQEFVKKGVEAPYLRLRDYSNRRMNMILADGLKLHQASQLTLYENREFVVQILSEPEVLPRDHMLYNVSVFDRANLKFGARQEILFEYRNQREHWIDILSNSVHEATGIPIESMRFAKPYQAQEVNVLEVEDFSWIDREQGRRYPNPQSLGIYGDRLVVADGSVPLKELTKEERAALLAIVDKSSDSELLYPTATYGPMMPSHYGASSTYKYSKPKEAALVIRTKQNKSSNGNGDSVPVSPAVSNDGDNDTKEYERQGGMVLFEDLH